MNAYGSMEQNKRLFIDDSSLWFGGAVLFDYIIAHSRAKGKKGYNNVTYL